MKTTETASFSIKGVTLAVTDMQAMLNFYSEVFGVHFEELRMYGSTLYSGEWGKLKLLLCPAEVANNTAKQNRHQFEIVVNDLREMIVTVREHQGELMGEISENERQLQAGIYDPDRNSLVLIQNKT